MKESGRLASPSGLISAAFNGVHCVSQAIAEHDVGSQSDRNQGTAPGQAAVKVNDVLATAPLVQSVDLLSNTPPGAHRLEAGGTAWVGLGSALATLGQPSADRLQYLRLLPRPE